MAIEVTEEMVQAARRLMPARWSMHDLHDAIAAAIQAAPVPELEFEVRGEPGPELSVVDGLPLLGSCVVGPGVVDLAPAPGDVVLAGISEIADRYGVARPTVNGWIKRAEKIGMPPPLAILAAGPVYNLTRLDPWYQQWKSTADDDNAAA